MLKRWATAAATLASLVCLTGCGMFHLVKRPTATVTAVRLVDSTDQGARLEVTVELTNPNDVALPLVEDKLNLHVAADGSYAYADIPKRTLPAHGRQTVVVPAAVVSGGHDIAGRSCRVTGWFRYEPPGDLRRFLTESGLPLPTVTFATNQALDK